MNRPTLTITLARRWTVITLRMTLGIRLGMTLAMTFLAAGCFYPPTQKPPAPAKDEITLDPVSYTHLTLPTICSV